MSTKTIVILSLIILLCLGVIALSLFFSPPLFSMFDRFRGGGPFGRRPMFFPFGPFGPFGRHFTGWREIAATLASYVFLYLTGVLMLFAFPRSLRTMRDGLSRGMGEIFRLLGIGAFSLIALLFLIALGFFASAAFPLPFLLIAILLLMAWGGLVGLSLAVGRGLVRLAGGLQSSPLFDLALGVLIIFTLGHIPIAGWVIIGLFGMLALGAVVATRFGSGATWSLAEFSASEAPAPMAPVEEPPQ
jgi:hypothetical protein